VEPWTERPLSRHRLAVVDLIRRAKEDHATVGGVFEWDVTDTLARIERDRAAGREVGLAAFMVKATATLLARHPRLNSRLFRRWFRLREVQWAEVSCNVVIARDGPDGRQFLLPAVIRNADRTPLEEVHTTIRRWKSADLATLDEARAIDRVRRAPRAAVWLYNRMIRRSPAFFLARHGTYGLSMLVDDVAGSVGGQAWSPSTTFYPASVAQKPAVYRGEVVPRWLMTLGILVDHYVVDGLEVLAAARDLRKLVEEPEHVLGPG
jgi:pyruvate/2-oxoglutarate dehydrogenase complex dihydrolipoamide acyltransferase (E2) component